MPVDPVNRLPNYHITQSSEANDEERRREKDAHSGGGKKKVAEKTSSAPFNPEKPAASQEKNMESELPGQLVDSGTVIELLSHVPKVTPMKGHNPFKSVNKPTDPIPTDRQNKKLNKSL